jgi:23S rRNA pseudouridine2605 synthase
MPEVRLNKYLADHGVASRRRCDELIAAGRVLVDGRPVTELGTRIDPEAAKVEVEGRVIEPRARARHHYYLLNKPKGVICTNDRREARKRAIDLITDPDAGRIYTVGRLDEESTGLILLTNDGEFTNLIAHPRNEVPKTYLAKVRGRIDGAAIERLARGVHLAEGKTGPIRVRVGKRTQQFSTLSVTLAEGKNREVRRVFAKVGFDVLALRRTRIGNLSDRGLKEGQWRPLLREELRDLVAVARGEREVRDEADERPGGRRRRPGGRPDGARRAARPPRGKPRPLPVRRRRQEEPRGRRGRGQRRAQGKSR